MLSYGLLSYHPLLYYYYYYYYYYSYHCHDTGSSKIRHSCLEVIL